MNFVRDSGNHLVIIADSTSSCNYANFWIERILKSNKCSDNNDMNLFMYAKLIMPIIHDGSIEKCRREGISIYTTVNPMLNGMSKFCSRNATYLDVHNKMYNYDYILV